MKLIPMLMLELIVFISLNTIILILIKFYILKSQDFIFRVQRKAYLMNFLNYFEIFLNEIRKFDIACGEFEVPGGIPSINLRRQRQ